MSVKLLVITHNLIGQEMIATATSILGGGYPPIHFVSVPSNLEPQNLGDYADQVKQAIGELISDQGVLILTDIFGATPCNLAGYFAAGLKVKVVSGLNLPMLVRVLSYRSKDIDQLVTIAIEGARTGIT